MGRVVAVAVAVSVAMAELEASRLVAAGAGPMEAAEATRPFLAVLAAAVAAAYIRLQKSGTEGATNLATAPVRHRNTVS